MHLYVCCDGDQHSYPLRPSSNCVLYSFHFVFIVILKTSFILTDDRNETPDSKHMCNLSTGALVVIRRAGFEALLSRL